MICWRVVVVRLYPCACCLCISPHFAEDRTQLSKGNFQDRSAFLLDKLGGFLPSLGEQRLWYRHAITEFSGLRTEQCHHCLMVLTGPISWGSSLCPSVSLTCPVVSAFLWRDPLILFVWQLWQAGGWSMPSATIAQIMRRPTNICLSFPFPRTKWIWLLLKMNYMPSCIDWHLSHSTLDRPRQGEFACLCQGWMRPELAHNESPQNKFLSAPTPCQQNSTLQFT